MRAHFPALAGAALALAGVPAAWGNLSSGSSEQGADAEASTPPPPPAPVKKDTGDAAPVDDAAAETNHRYCNQQHHGQTNPCRSDRTDYCCNFDCTHCGPVTYCRTESPFLRDSGVCNPNYVGGICANYYQLCPGGTGYPTAYPFSPETSPCVYLGNNCWRSRYADSSNNYGNNDQCSMWLPSPRPARITVWRFNTETNYDKLFVDGVAYSGTSGPNGRPVHNTLTWSTDGSVTRSGWHICLASVSTDYPTATGYPTREYFHCVNLGNNCWRSRYHDTDSQYGNNDQCNIPLPGGGPRSITVYRFDTEASHDRLTVDGVHYSGSGLGNSPNGRTVHSSLSWRTDGSVTRSGWHLCLVAPPTGYPTNYPTTLYPTHSPTGYPTRESTHCVYLGNNCWRTRYVDTDNQYGNNDYCSLPLPGGGPASISVFRFETESTHDTLSVDGVRYSGSGVGQSPNGRTAHSSLIWRTDGSVTRNGWHLCLAPLTEYPTAPSGYPTMYPTAPTNFPTGYPVSEASHCVYLGNDCWRSRYAHDGHYGDSDQCSIPLPSGGPSRIFVHRFDTEACCDKLTVDGTDYSGTSGPHHVFVHNSLRWRADGSVTRTGWHICLAVQTAYPTARTSSPTEYPTAPTAWPTWATEYPTAPTGFPTRYPVAVTGFPTRTGFPSRSPSGYPSGFPSQGTLPPGSGPVRFSSCTVSPGRYTVDGVQRDSPCYLGGRDRHADYVGAYGDSARLYTCSIANRHHFVLCTCSGATCVGNEEPRTCFVAQDNSMGCVGMLRGAVFSTDGTKAFFACSKEVRVCRVDLSSRNGNWYSHCQVLQNAGCPRWAGIRGVAARPRSGRGDLLVVVCTDWKTRACSLDSGNMQMQPGRQCVKGGRETVCNGIGKPSGLSFNADNKLLVPCDDGFSYSKFVGGIVQDITHTAYIGVRPCPAEVKSFADLSSGRAAVACGPDGVRECQVQYS